MYINAVNIRVRCLLIYGMFRFCRYCLPLNWSTHQYFFSSQFIVLFQNNSLIINPNYLWTFPLMFVLRYICTSQIGTLEDSADKFHQPIRGRCTIERHKLMYSPDGATDGTTRVWEVPYLTKLFSPINVLQCCCRNYVPLFNIQKFIRGKFQSTILCPFDQMPYKPSVWIFSFQISGIINK